MIFLSIYNNPFIKIDKEINIIPSPRAKDKSPLDVSITIVVVITRVIWAIFPPTIITAPTSANALPSPARATVNKENLASQSNV